MSMGPSTMESPSPSMKKNASWSLLAEFANEKLGALELRDDDDAVAHVHGETSHQQNQNHSLPSMHSGRPSSPIAATSTVRRGSNWSMFSMDSADDYDPSTMDLKARARQHQTNHQSMFSSIALPTKKGQPKKDPLVEFHEKHSLAEREHRQKEAEKRRRQCRNYDDDKSLASMGSFFDYLTKSGAADELLEDDGALDDGDKSCATGVSAQSMSSFFGLFGDDAEEIAKLSSSGQRPKEEPSLQKAVKQSKSVKGNRVYARGRRSAENGDWKKAVAYYHIALVKQRKHYGEDHVVTADTLNALGVALTNLGEHFGALTALEEALQIRQDLLGAGAEEVAETTSNIWMVLRASRDGC